MNRIRFAFALAALLLWAPARPQTAEPQRSSLPSRELAPAQLLAELRKGGYILYFRHAATDYSQNDEKMKSIEDCANQRNLIDRGRSDARIVAAAIRRLGIPVERVSRVRSAARWKRRSCSSDARRKCRKCAGGRALRQTRGATRPCGGSWPRRYPPGPTSPSSATAIRSTASPVRPISPKVKRP